MKNTKFNLLLTGIILSVALVSCSYMEDASSGPEVTPISAKALNIGANPGGNVTCSEVATYYGTSFSFSSDRVNWDGSNFDNGWPVGLIVSVQTVDGTDYIDFSYSSTTHCVGAVIVKGSSDANIYYYPTGIKSDQALTAPINASGDPAGLSNLTFCFVECESEPCWTAETAFGGETEGGGSAWWFAFDTQGDLIQKIYAGQKEVPGAYIQYDKVNDVITIVLGENLKLQDAVTVTKPHPRTGALVTSTNDEQVKVQGYNELPASRPSAGLFSLYKGRNLVIQGNGSRYYVIHLDVEVNDCK